MPELSPRETLESKGDECFSPVLQRGGLGKSYPKNDELLETESGSDCDNDQLNEKTQQILEGVIAFVDVRSNHDNRSAGVGKVLERLGATVVKKLIPEITHVVFSNGLQSTLNHVDKYNAQFVSVLWVDSCMKSNCRVDEHLYPASRVDAISPMPLMRGKSKRLKSMQPKPFENGVDNSKTESKRKKRNLPKDKTMDSPFAYISLEDIEMKDLSKKMKDHDAHFYSPISTGSPFFNQVMKKLSEKRASLGESPECTRNRTSAKKETLPLELGNEEQAPKNKEDQYADDNVFNVDSCAGFEKIPYMQDFEPASAERQAACRKIYSEGAAATDNSKPCEPEEEEDWPTPLDCEPMDLAPKLDRAAEVSADEMEEDGDTHGLNYHATKKATDDCVGNSKNLDVCSYSKPIRKKKKLLSKSQMLTSILNFSSRNNGDEKAIDGAVTSSERFDNQQREKKTPTKRKRQQEISPRKRQKGNKEISSNKNEFFDEEVQIDMNENAVQMDTDADNDDRQSEVDEANSGDNVEERKNSEKESYNGKKKRPKGCLVMTSLHSSQQDFIRNAVKTLGSFVISKTVNLSTTHVISGSGRRTLNILNGIAHGCWILSPNWINCSYDEGHWLNEEGFELVDVFQTAMKNRCSRLATGRSLSSVLFENEDPFYIAEDTVPPKAEIIKLIRKCGGQVTSNVSKAKICIGKHQQTELHCVEEKWLLDCIMNTEVLSTDDYIIEKLGNT
ncbi:microcephalin-like [Rhopilema esculentum]|uniref:microcephalin-like n=1 Tax=Rhopilema esculentum TaxID=499914 RepID=UPI0031E1153B|eukprot:gene6171-11568_t